MCLLDAFLVSDICRRNAVPALAQIWRGQGTGHGAEAACQHHCNSIMTVRKPAIVLCRLAVIINLDLTMEAKASLHYKPVTSRDLPGLSYSLIWIPSHRLFQLLILFVSLHTQYSAIGESRWAGIPRRREEWKGSVSVKSQECEVDIAGLRVTFAQTLIWSTTRH